ncbi:MAG: UvrB/UvrC motif-containing protein [Peptoniphilus sp.]|nr:UvrB/UvrC motif-containing protein [Peptoniphilus sp.]MDD7363790.1 UvrB/UvrC motif-containing protein [Bacillota bacterium]MDY6044631.1 UvrB/UvrC motif-containing protein [Peptoniphilus sp.]
MLCQHCHENEATITYTTVEGNQTKEMHVCRSCFEKLLKQQFPEAQVPPLDIQPVMQELLSLFNIGAGAESEEKVCPKCHTKLETFRKTGMFGCDTCYDTFSEELEKILPRIQGARKHVGERPAKQEEEEIRDEKKADLKRQLDVAIADERYEDAAILRDEIKALQEAGSHEE